MVRRRSTYEIVIVWSSFIHKFSANLICYNLTALKAWLNIHAERAQYLVVLPHVLINDEFSILTSVGRAQSMVSA